MERKWSELSAEEKREERFKRWLSAEDVNFVSPEAEALYKERVQRFIDVIQLKEPDRVPVMTPTGYIPAHYCGFTIREAMYDAEKVVASWEKYIKDFDHDTIPGAGMSRCGKALDILGNKGLKWAGNGLPDDCDTQVIETENLKATEWDLFTKDRSDYQIRYYLPRAYKAAEPLSKLPPLNTIQGGIATFSDPDILAAFKALGEAGKVEVEWRKMTAGISRRALENGIPNFTGTVGGGGAPFDSIGILRGTKGTIMDMFQRPDRLLAYMEDVTTLSINRAVRSVDMTGSPVVRMPLHRGADGWMSEEQFLTFYWPFFKRVLLGFIAEGLVPCPFAEGGYNSRLEIISELPVGSVIWHFDKTDMVRAKEILGDRACIMGNVPTSLLISGTPEEVKKYCKELIETVGKDGGYILSYGATPNQAKIENVNAMRDSAKEYGIYRK